jgi:hypothetical protein
VSTRQQLGFVSASDPPVSDADYVQLCRLVTEHVWRADNGRSDTLHELYVEDGELDLGGPTPLRGRQAIHEWGRQLAQNPPWKTIRHVCTDMRFVMDGSDSARGTMVLIVFMDPDGTQPSAPWNIGEDHDRYLRTDEGWRIASRRWVNMFTRGDTLEVT